MQVRQILRAPAGLKIACHPEWKTSKLMEHQTHTILSCNAYALHQKRIYPNLNQAYLLCVECKLLPQTSDLNSRYLANGSSLR